MTLLNTAQQVVRGTQPQMASKVHLGGEQVWPVVAPGLRDLILSHSPVHYWPLDDAAFPMIDLGSGGIDITVGMSRGSFSFQEPVGGTVVGVRPAITSNNDVAIPGVLPSEISDATIVAFGFDWGSSTDDYATPLAHWPNDDAQKILFGGNPRLTGNPWRAALRPYTATIGGWDSGTDGTPVAGSVWSYALTIQPTNEATLYHNAVGASIALPDNRWRDPAVPNAFTLFSRGDRTSTRGAWNRPICHVAIMDKALPPSDISDLHQAFLADTT